MQHNKVEVDLLLIGKTGNGKSALGNTILNKTSFISKSTATSVTKDIQSEYNELDGRIITVVDGPGVADTSMDAEEYVQVMMEQMSRAIAANDRGFHAFLLVFKYGGRFTTEEQSSIDFLKKIFGENFVRKFCILALSCGDVFDTEKEDTGMSFEKWLSEQNGGFSQLINECNRRVLIFDNKTKDENKKAQQRDLLFKMIDKLTFDGHRYTDENFQNVQDARERYLLETSVPFIEQETMKETSLIISKLKQLQSTEESHEKKICDLCELSERAKTLHESVSSRDKGTGILQELTEIVQSIVNSIDVEIQITHRMESLRKETEVKQRSLEEKFLSENEELKKIISSLKIDEDKHIELITILESCLRTEQKTMNNLENMFDRERIDNQNKIDKLTAKYKKIKAKNEKGFFNSIKNTFKFKKANSKN